MATYNTTAAAITRAHQIAAQELKSKLRDEGCRQTEIRISDRPTAIARHLSEHPNILERARADIERWRFAKIRTSAQRRGR